MHMQYDDVTYIIITYIITYNQLMNGFAHDIHYAFI